MLDDSCVRRRRGVQADASKHEELSSTTGKRTKKAEPTSWVRQILVLGAPVLAFVAAALLARQLARPTPLGEVYALCSRDGRGIYTVDESLPTVQCIGVNGTTIFDRGRLSDIRSRWATENQGQLDVRMIEHGSVVLPGLSDSHAHILEYGASLVIPLNQARDVKDAVNFIKDYVLAAPEISGNTSKFIEGWGWDHTAWPGNAWPTAADLDQEPVLRGRRIVLQSKDGHALWVSSSVIEAMGSIPADIEGGVYTRNVNGEPAGVFIDKAQDYVPREPLNDMDLQRRFLATVDYAHRHGLTSIHDAGFSPASLEFFKRQASAGPLPIRVYGMTYFDDAAAYWGGTREKIVDYNRLTARSVKMFADGALRSGYAALHEPYHDNHGTKGVMRLTREVLDDAVPRFIADGWQVNIHAIGDRANAIVLDAFEASLKNVNTAVVRPRLEHAQILTPADIERIAALGVIASIQPTHAISDMAFAEARLGPERAKGIYAFRSLVNAGARVTFGSDAPVEDLHPITSFYAAVTRLSPEGTSPHGAGGWFPEQRLTRQMALKGMTISPAHASFTEDVLGSLEIGKRADFVVLSQDIMQVPVEDILATEVMATVIDGRPVFGKI